MPDDALLAVGDQLWIPRAELTFRATRSGGPGGQHVNTSSTRIELEWNVAGSPSVSEEQRARILRVLANRISGEGVLRITASEERSQHRNREAAEGRLVTLVTEALHVPRARRKTRPPRASRERRLAAKRRRSETKRLRDSVSDD
ncbi:MAG: aminoacyl-tRNA hydrolase [Gemmatimonadota bacterium]|nr:aminoacyl-tRNA hydrolase [Gemmatimonadota bacterium]